MAPTDLAKKGGLNLTKALKSAARLPRRVGRSTSGRGGGVGGSGNGNGNGNSRSFAPQPNEQPIVVLRLQVISCMQLLAKDRGGTSDPFVVASVLNNRRQTPVAKKTLNPTYQPKDATFDFPIYLSLADKLGVLELVVWDKDMLSKEYLGEVGLPLEDWFLEKDGTPRPYAWDEPSNKAFSLKLLSTKSHTVATGSVQIKIGFASPPNTESLMEWEDVYRDLVKRSRPSLVSAPATHGVGTVRSSEGGPNFEDDGGLSSGSEDEDDLDDDEPFFDAPESEQPAAPSTPPENEAVSPSTPTPLSVASAPAAPAAPAVAPPVARRTSGLIPKMKFPRKLTGRSTSSSSSTNMYSGSSLPIPSSSSEGIAESKKPGKLSSSRNVSPAGSDAGAADTKKTKKKSGYQLEGGKDILGIVMLEIQSAEDLPRLSNMTRTGWDMDPFVVVSFGKKVFRTRVIRHSRNPVWDEKLLFHVRRYETTFKVQLAVLDWDKLSANDYVGDVSFDVKELIESAPQPDMVTGLYDASEDGAHSMKEFNLPLQTSKNVAWESKHAPRIKLRAKYQPYDALRQRFWRQYLQQYDTDDTNALSHIELTSMLDSLGSTLAHSTISSFFTRFGKNAHADELSFEEAILCLEAELGRPVSEKRRLDAEDVEGGSVSATPVLRAEDGRGREVKLEDMDFSGPVGREQGAGGGEHSPGHVAVPVYHRQQGQGQQPLSELVSSEATTPETSDVNEDAPAPTEKKKKRKLRFKKSSKTHPDSEASSSSAGTGSSSDDASALVERVINVKNCPLCHRPRMNAKAEMDIVTHLAVCASQDWNAVDKIVVGNFVTASQAQRKWYTKVLGKVSAGDYKLGANSANIIVQNRITGQLEEEKMQVYVRLGIRLLYKGASSRMEGGRARKLLKSLSIKQGVKYDDPASAAEIPAFIVFHNLAVEEILDPLDSFKTFNQFFYRKLKPSARPIESPSDPTRLVSAADCRLMAFSSVSEATRIWIKGRDFTVSRLLGPGYGGEAECERYRGGAVAIFRLAPQDYHRFHSPVEGRVGRMVDIAGEYYTVNPQAIRTALDVYGENARKVVPIESPQFGRVMAVCVGAMMVGSIETTVEEGQDVQRGQEFGFFAFGGSTIVLLFEKGAVEWDEDLLINGRASLETLVRVGMGIGRRATTPKA